MSAARKLARLRAGARGRAGARARGNTHTLYFCVDISFEPNS